MAVKPARIPLEPREGRQSVSIKVLPEAGCAERVPDETVLWIGTSRVRDASGPVMIIERRRMARKRSVRVTESSGNVFRDLGFRHEEAEHLLVRADLLIQLYKALKARGLKQARAAKLLEVTQPRVSDLLRGRIDLFSTDTLIDMLARVGIEVRVVLRPGRRHRAA